MSSSRSDVVTQSVLPFFRSSVLPSLFFLLVFLKSFLALKSFNGVSRLFKGCLKFQGSFKEVLRVFTKVLRKFKWCFKEASRVFQESFREISRQFQESFKGISSKIEGPFK